MLAISTRAETDDPSSTNTLRRTSSSTYLFCRRDTCRGETTCLYLVESHNYFLDRVNFFLGIDASYRYTKIH